MKQKVSLSNFSTIASLIIVVVMIGLMFIIKEPWVVILLGVVLVGMCLSALFYMPLSLSADDNYLYINRPLRVKAIPLSDIASIKLAPGFFVTWKGIRLCGSGGWLGYWGWFRAPEVGKYFAYYGDGKRCFLITLKDGRKYMLGCDNRDQMIAYLQKHIK